MPKTKPYTEFIGQYYFLSEIIDENFKQFYKRTNDEYLFDIVESYENWISQINSTRNHDGTSYNWIMVETKMKSTDKANSLRKTKKKQANSSY